MIISGSINPCIKSRDEIKKLSHILGVEPNKFTDEILSELRERSQDYIIRKEYEIGPNAIRSKSEIKKELALVNTATRKMITRLENLSEQSKAKLVDTAILNGDKCLQKYTIWHKGLPNTYDGVDKLIDEIQCFQDIVTSTMDGLRPNNRKRRASLRGYILYLYSLFERLTDERPKHRVYNIYEETYDAPFFLFVKECLKQSGEVIPDKTLGSQIETVFKYMKVKTPPK